MPTSKNVLKETTEYMNDYMPVYSPIFPLLLGAGKLHPQEVGKMTFKAFEAVSDLDAKHITPKDSEMHLISISEGSKVFKSYFLGSQLQISNLQNQDGAQKVVSQVLDRLNLQFDNLLLLGEGTSASTMINNSLYWSDDVNYQLESSDEIASSGQLWNLHANIMIQKAVADQLAGRKLFISYGDVPGKINSLLSSLATVLKAPLQESLGPLYEMVELPTAICPASAHGYIIVNMDRIIFHYSTLPKVDASGINTEKSYSWWNFLSGSCMVECLSDNAIIRQPLTFA